MISKHELNPKNFPVTPEIEANLSDLLKRVNKFQFFWGKPMYVTSGLRSLEDHKRIYKENAVKNGSTVVRIPMGSKHLIGQAVDFADPDGSMMAYCKANVEMLEQVGLWCEAETKGWVHFQSRPPGSNNRFFKP